MGEPTMSEIVKSRVRAAARTLGTTDPLPYVGRLIEETFALPAGDSHYGVNALTPGAVPFEPSFSEKEPQALRFTIEPLCPGSSPLARRNESTNEMRRLVGQEYGRNALNWFDGRSEEWRGTAGMTRLEFGAWFGTGYDSAGLQAAKIYYELAPNQIEALPPVLAKMVHIAGETMPGLVPIFTTITCRRNAGTQRITFYHRGPLRVAGLGPLMDRLGLGHQLPSIMQVVGLTLGGRFDLPERSVMVGLGEGGEGPELKLEIILGALPDLPTAFLNLLALGLNERPRQLRALDRWLHAFTPERYDEPGDFTAMSVRVTPRTSARVNLYLRPVEFQVRRLRLPAADRSPTHEHSGLNMTGVST